MAKKKKFRAEFRKNRTPRARKTDWTRQFDEHGFQEQAPETEERISGRGEMNRHRTICTSEASAELGNAEIPFDVLLDVDLGGLPPRARALGIRTGEHGVGRRWRRLSMCHAADPENAQHGRAQSGSRRRSRALSSRREHATQRGADRARRTAARHASPGRFAVAGRSSFPTSTSCLSWLVLPSRG